jgi:hypothetical protein
MESDPLIHAIHKPEKDEEMGSRLGDRRSYTNGSRRGERGEEEDLYDNLIKIADQIEPQIYQSDLRKFESSSGVSTTSTGQEKSQETDSPRRKSVERQSSRRNSAYGGGKKRSYLSLYKPLTSKTDRLIFKRKLCRLLSLFCCIMTTAIIFLFYFYSGINNQYLDVVWPNKDITIKVTNCRIFFEPQPGDSFKNTLYLDQRSSIKTVSYNIFQKNRRVSYSDEQHKFEYSVTHEDDILGCNLHLKFPEDVALNSVSIDCTNNCIIIQKSGSWATKSLKIHGDSASTNIAKVVVGDLDIQVDKGFVQINDLDMVSGSYSRSIIVGTGDIILESTKPTFIEFLTASENYCLSSFQTTLTTAVVKTDLGPELLKFQTQIHLQTHLFMSQWRGKASLCSKIACPVTSSSPEILLTNFDGNIFYNVLEEMPSFVHTDASILQGSRYLQGIALPQSTKLLIRANLDQTKQNNLPNLIIRFIFGNFDSWSLHGTKWVYTDHFIYSIIKPWWLSFFTLGKLVENTNTIKTYLSPGFCPYRKILSKTQKLYISGVLSKLLPMHRGSLSYLKNSQDQLEQDPLTPRDGFHSFANVAFFSDEWVQVKQVDGDHDIYRQVYLTENLGVFILMCLSIIATVIIAMNMTLTLINLLFKSFQFVREKLYHIEFYWKIHGRVSNSNRKDAAIQFTVEEDEGDKMQASSLKNFNIKFTRSYFDLPSTTAFMDFLILELWSSGQTSLNRFYDIAFEATTVSKYSDIDMQNLQQERVRLKELKSYYQQMCFLMNYKEDNLSSEESIALLSKKGMVLTSSDSNSLYLIRLTLNTTKDLSLSYLKNEKKQNSLQIFLERFCEHTNFDEDKVPFDKFSERYELFCKLNHLEPVMLDHIILKNRFGIESRTILKETVERDFTHHFIRDGFHSDTCLQKMISKVRGCFCKKQLYSLKVEQLKNVNLFLAGRLNESDVGMTEYSKIVTLAVLENYWWLKDFFSVILELLIEVALSIPFISIFIFQEIEHSSYSLRDESLNIYGFNTYNPDIWLVPQKIMNNYLLLIVSMLFLFFWLSCFVNTIANIAKLEFPWIKVFDPYRSDQITFSKFLNAYQWWFIIISFVGILWYICLVLVWDTIASILNSQAYLATTSMAVSFVYLLYSLNIEFAHIWWQSRSKFKTQFRSMWNARISIIVKKMIKYISERGGNLKGADSKEGASKAQLLLNDDIISTCRLNLEKVAAENPRTIPFFKFFYSLMSKNPALRNNMEDMLLESPFSFNKYTAELLGNILFISRTLKVDSFNIERNIKLCTSIIFYLREDIELVQLTLKDLGDLKQCQCEETTIVNTKNECSGCHGSRYQDKNIKDSIRHIRIDRNSNVMVDMLNILLHLQKRKIDQTMKIIEKLFIERFGEKNFEAAKPTFDLIHFVIFNLVENYDYVKLTRIFVDFMKKSLKADMNLTEILMLFLLKDNFILANERGQAYDFVSITRIYKRQICSSGPFLKERRMLVRYLFLSTAFLAGESQINEELILEITNELNYNVGNLFHLRPELVLLMIHYPLYFTQTASTIHAKIMRHADNCSISPDLSGLLYNFSMIANGTATNKKDSEAFLTRSSSFNMIRTRLDLSFKELFGIIYLMRADVQNEYFDKIISYILNKYSLYSYKRHVDSLLHLALSYDRNIILKELSIFAKFVGQNTQHLELLGRVLFFFKRVGDEEAQMKKDLEVLYDSLSAKKMGEGQAQLKDIFIECIISRNYSKFKTFKENMLYLSRRKGNPKGKLDPDLSLILDIIEFFYELNFGTDVHDLLNKYKEFVPEFEINALFNLCIKLLKTINGFKVANKEVVSERMKESFNSLGEIMLGRPNDFENLWILIFSSDPAVKLAALNSFIDIARCLGDTSVVDYDRVKFHSQYIDKKVKFVKNQHMFVARFANSTGYKPFQFGMFVIKRMFMRSFKVSQGEISIMLSSIASKLVAECSEENLLVDADPLGSHPAQENIPKEKILIRIEDHKITRFYAALMDFIVNEDSASLAAHFLEDHEEPMLQTLAFCRYCSSPNEIINRIFEQLMANNHHRLCALLYFYYLVEGLIQRRKITLKTTLEQSINDWVNIKPEFLEFIELYIDREPSSMVAMVVKIQNRVLFNKYSDQDLHKVSPMLEKVMGKEFYENIETIIEGNQPNLLYLSDLFRIPLKKIKFIYILTTLKLNTNTNYTFDQFISNQDVMNILQTRQVNPQELLSLLKVCLNQIDYDAITDLLRLMKLDHAIHPEVLINLLLLDLKVEKTPLSYRDFNKKLLVYSAIFERLKLMKIACWAFIRVLKGDFLIYCELIDLLNEDSMPQNHKYFSSIMTGMIGIKNYIYIDKKTEDALKLGGFPQYFQALNSHFTRFKNGEKENSYEYAQFMLQNCKSGFRIHPLWGGIVEALIDPTIDSTQQDKPMTSIDSNGYVKLPFIHKCKLLHFIALYNLVNADETIVEFLHDFALFRNIRNYLKKHMFLDITDPEKREELRPMLDFYNKIVERYNTIMKEIINDKKIVFDYASFARNPDKTFQGLLMGVCEVESLVMAEEFHAALNKTLLQEWKEDLHDRQRKPNITREDSEMCDRLIKKIEDLFHLNKKLLNDPFKMFVTYENVASKDYWDREFDEVRYLDGFLDSVIKVFMNSLDEVAQYLSFYKLSHSDDLQDYPSHVPSMQDDSESSDSYDSSSEPSRINARGEDNIYSNNQDLDENLTVQWFGLSVYILLKRLRQYQQLSSFSKSEKFSEIVYKSNILFGVLEKALFFVSAGNSFRKYMYFAQFTFSIGIRLPSKSYAKFAASLFMPELFQWSQELNSRYSFSYISKAKMIMEVYENDRKYFPNKGFFTQYCYDKHNESHLINNVINMAMEKIDISIITMPRSLIMRENDEQLAVDYYTLQFLADPLYESLWSEERTKFITNFVFSRGKEEQMQRNDPRGKEETNRDPALLSMRLIIHKYYSKLKGSMHQDAVVSLTESYFSKKLQPREGSDGKDIGTIKFTSLKFYNPHLKFLNDLALGTYSVLSETKNIFTEHIDLANHQKIYEAILHLHSCRRNFSKSLLKSSLTTLSQYLTSNLHNLYSVLEFVIEPNHNGNADVGFYLFRELGLRNQSFFHLFLLHTYPSNLRMLFIEKIIEDLGIPEISSFKEIIGMFVNLCYLVKSDRETEFTKQQFTVLAKGILGKTCTEQRTTTSNGLTNKRDNGLNSNYRRNRKSLQIDSKDQDLVSLIYDRISARKLKHKQKKGIESFYQLFEEMGAQNNSKFEYDRDLVVCFKNFILEITRKNKKSYLVKFEKNTKSIRTIFAAENSSLMIVFDIIHWLTYQKKNSLEEFEETLNNFFSSPSFNSSSTLQIPPEVKKFREMLVFICAFYKADIEGMLRFLQKHSMVEEYAFVLSYFVYTGVLNNHLDPIDRDSDLRKYVSICLAFPLVQQVYSALGAADMGRHANISPDQLHLRMSFAKMVKVISTLPQAAILEKLNLEDFRRNRSLNDNDELQRETNSLELLISGKLFTAFDSEIATILREYLNFNDNPIINRTVDKIKNFFYFKPEYYKDPEGTGINPDCPDYIKSAFTMRDYWEYLKTKFATSSKELIGKEMMGGMLKDVHLTKTDFKFMNVDAEENNQLTSCIYPSMIFAFLYLKNVRMAMDKNDNAARLVVIKHTLDFMWKLFKKMASNVGETVALSKQTTERHAHKTTVFHSNQLARVAEDDEKDEGGMGGDRHRSRRPDEIRDPLDGIGMHRKEDKQDFLSKYTATLFHLKTKKSTLVLLKDLLKFAKRFIFTIQDRRGHDHKIESFVDNMKLDNIMELYDYLEELENGKEISENYKENIVNLFIQIVAQYDRLKKLIPDIRALVKLIQGDMTRLDYFIDKLFIKSDSVVIHLTLGWLYSKQYQELHERLE